MPTPSLHDGRGSRPCRSRAAWLARAALLLLSFAAAARAQQSVGYVLEVEGNWSVSGGSGSLGKGASLPAGGLLRNSSPADGDRVVVADLNGEVIKRVRCKSGECKECRDSGTCYDPIRPLPQAKAKPGLLSAAFDAVMGLIWGEPDKYSVHRVRAGALPDGVVRLADGKLDLAPILSRSEKGQYAARLKPVAQKAGAAAKGAPAAFNIDWDPTRPDAVAVGALPPGLYELTLTQGAGAITATESRAWLLVGGAASYARLSSAFEQGVAVTRGWKDDVSPEAARQFLRAYLDQLARQEYAKDR